MEKEFVPYEQALALKELGFDELCIARFDGGGFRMLPVYDPLKNSDIKEAWFCVAPLYQQAFRWFREKYDIFIQPFKLDGKYIFQLYFEDKPPTFTDKFDSYEEAELECLKKLIEIIKEK